MRTYCSLNKIVDPGLRAEIAEKYGLILELDPEASPHAFEMCEKMAKFMPALIARLNAMYPRKERVRETHWGIFTHQEPKAFAYIAHEPHDYEFIGITHGMIFAATDLYNRILAHPENFPNLGDPSVEDAIQAPGLADAPLSEVWWRKMVAPKCPVRNYLARNWTYVCLELIIFHELAHLGHGHNDYLDHLQREDRKEPLLRQALEMDADGASVLSALAWNNEKRVAFATNKYPNPDLNAALQIAYGSHHAYVMSILLAGYAYFRLLSKPFDLNNTSTCTHPPVAIRMRFLVYSLLENIQNSEGIGFDLATFVKDAGQIFGAIEHALGLIAGEPGGRELWDSVFSTPQVSAYYILLKARFAQATPELGKYTKVLALPTFDFPPILMPPT